MRRTTKANVATSPYSIIGLCALAFSLAAPCAQAAPDDCGADAQERAAFIAQTMIAELDAGAGPAGHPLWMSAFLLAPEDEGERLARYCADNPQASLRSALDALR